MKKLFTRFLSIAFLALMGGVNSAWAYEVPEGYVTKYLCDFNNSTTPFTYSAGTAGETVYANSINGGDGNLMWQTKYTADRTMNLNFSNNDVFKNATNYIFEFDWNASSSNGNGNTLTINGASGVLLTVTQPGNSAPTKTFKNSLGDELGTHAYANSRDLSAPKKFYHFKFVANEEDGVVLTITYNDATPVTIVNSVKIADFTTIASISDVCGKSYHYVIWDDIVLFTPKKTIVTTVKTWDLKKISSSTVWIGLDDSETFNINGTTMKKSTSAAVDGILFDSNGNIWRVGNFGLRQQSGNTSKNISIPSLKAGDVVTIVGSWSGTEASVITAVSSNASIETSDDNKTSTITMTSDGDLSIGLRRTQGDNYYTAVSIELVHKEVKFIFEAGDDATVAIVNPSFETGDMTGWTPGSTTGGDTGVKQNSNATYTISNADGNYVYNTWGVTPLSLSQTLTNLPAGVYSLTALLASDQNNVITLSCGGESVDATMENGKGTGQDATVDFILTEEGNATISVTSNTWFKADNFRLTYVGPAVSATMTCGANKYGTFVAPFDVTIPDGVTAYSAEVNGDKVSLTKIESETLAPGTPVIIKATADVNETFYGVSTVSENPTEGCLIGLLTDLTVPEGAYVLQTQGGVQAFYKLAQDATGAVNRCYVTINSQNAKFAISIADEEATANDVVEVETVKVLPVKFFKNNQIVIMKNGKQYNAAGAEK